MAKVIVTKALDDTLALEAYLHVRADSKPEALMKALDALEAHTEETGQGFSIETYTIVSGAFVGEFKVTVK